ncbi:MAG: glycosyl transferase, partial [Candidatus Margulisiibacteriota bacterium]
DQGGRYLYIKDDKTGQYFSPTWQPVRKKLDKYECRHGLGYTTISSECMGIETKITYFVPLGEDLEIWKVEVEALEPAAKSRGSKSNRNREFYSQVPIRELTLFSYVEFCLWDAVGDSTNFQRTWSIGQAHCEGSTIIHDTMYGNWVDIFAYFSTSEKIHSYDCQRRDFLGDHGYNNLDKPKAVVNGKCSNSTAIGWAPIGSHCIKLKLKPGQKKTIIFVLGVAPKNQISKSKIKKFTNIKNVDLELKKLKDYWKNNLSKFNAETPDPEMNTSLNIWNQYQCMQTFNWSRYASYYEAGIGRGMGFRDSNQDTLGFAHMIPKEAKKRILELAATQFKDGSTFHQYSPITQKGDLIGYSDDPLWMVFSTANYIKETGDFGILKEKVLFATIDEREVVQVGHHNYGKIQNPKSKISRFAGSRNSYINIAEAGQIKKASLYEHLKLGISRVAKDLGPHGLPLAKFADWNDCINMLGKNGAAESVLVGEMLVASCNEMVKLIENNPALPITRYALREFQNISKKMKKTLNKVAWDGEWYLRAFDDNKRPLGAKKDKDAKIFLETQPWAVISGVADGGRGRICMDSVRKNLFTKYGIKLLDPPFRTYRPELGEISTYPAGLKENASIFCHPNPWAMVAECLLGRGDRAYEYYRAILPAAQNEIADIRKTEPYVYCQMVAGPDHPDFGEGKNSWLTGSAAWNFYAASQYLLGIRPDYNGLVIDPCIPLNWKGFKVSRTFRGTRYIINVKRAKFNAPKKLLIVDGKKIEGNIAPIFKDRREHVIEAYIS